MPVAPAPSSHLHNNHQLFSNHYLSHTPPRRADRGALLDAAHDRHTDGTTQREADLNARVYALFHLTAEEIKLIEAATKYKYGEG